MSVLFLALTAAERGWVPDALLRAGIRRLCEERLREESRRNPTGHQESLATFIEWMKSGPIAPVPEKANEQHYALPADFFARVLGPHRKYSCCHWEEGTTSLAEAERSALEISCERAGLADGQEILELGCGWGSLSLFMAARYPESRVTGVSNSAPQRAAIEAQAARAGIRNLRIVTADMNAFDTDVRFDRVVSVEMFEHMRNYEMLLQRIARWLVPDGKLFVHIFSHRERAYAFETEGANNWMGRYFFTGGIMPSDDLLTSFQCDLTLSHRWRWNGVHYRKTTEAWLENLDRRRDEILPILEQAYGPAEARRWFHRWRLFFLACSELFGYAKGTEWGVSHYLFKKRLATTTARPIENR